MGRLSWKSLSLSWGNIEWPPMLDPVCDDCPWDCEYWVWPNWAMRNWWSCSILRHASSILASFSFVFIFVFSTFTSLNDLTFASSISVRALFLSFVSANSSRLVSSSAKMVAVNLSLVVAGFASLA
ncbi:hypothetical protein B0H16DRAFT_1577764 [Mycena metata]|uniref:Uncharacterized protein n=1 Tax=Mycena metata TaxID=1033252 RepID=A0AAD7I4L9_9AGAR|nr:hypothetical protein B0H16DRAFT_1577764 [Mycena metata]